MTKIEAFLKKEDDVSLANLGHLSDAKTVAFTVDVEEWFQVGAFETVFDRSEWPSLESRVELQTHAVLALLRDLQIQATFFCLGWVAERLPDLIKTIADAGHEVACHGMDHRRLFTMSPLEFERDVKAAKNLLEAASGKPVRGYRAPSFSLTSEVWWVYKILADAGFDYSSSLYPVKTDHYGENSAPRGPFHPHSADSLLEIPMTVCDLPLKRVPASGGGYFRLLPYFLSRHFMRAGPAQAGAPGIFYMHPWEMDTEQPYISRAPLLSRFRHYTGQSRLPKKLTALAKDFKFGRMDDIYSSLLNNSPRA